MTKLIFYGWEIGMRGIPFAQLLKEKVNLGLKESMDIKERIKSGIIYELTLDDDNLANKIYEKSREYKVLVRKEVL